jgi:hypothetical protein
MPKAAFNPFARPADAAVLAIMRKLGPGLAAPTQMAAAMPSMEVISVMGSFLTVGDLKKPNVWLRTALPVPVSEAKRTI